MAPAVNFTAVAVVFKNECTRDLSLRAKSPLFGQLLVLVLVLLVLVVLVLVLVNMPSKPQGFLSVSRGCQKQSKMEQIPGSAAAENVTEMSPRVTASSMSQEGALTPWCPRGSNHSS